MKSNTDELLTKYGVYPVQPMKYPTAERSRLRIVPSPQHSEEIMETDGGADVAENGLVQLVFLSQACSTWYDYQYRCSTNKKVDCN